MKLLKSTLVLLMVMQLFSCSQAPIPRNRLAEIMVEMFSVDQAIQQDFSLRSVADTTLVYAAILQKHGYTVDDFHESLAYHLHEPEKFKKAFHKRREEIITKKNKLHVDVQMIRTPHTDSLWRQIQHRSLRNILQQNPLDPNSWDTTIVDTTVVFHYPMRYMAHSSPDSIQDTVSPKYEKDSRKLLIPHNISPY